MKKRTYKLCIRVLEDEVARLGKELRDRSRRVMDSDARFRTKCNDILCLQDDKRKLEARTAQYAQTVERQEEDMVRMEKHIVFLEETIRQLKDTIDKLRS